MKAAKYLYPNEFIRPYSRIYDYDPIIQSFGKVLIKVDDDDYQGDSRVILKKDDKYGLLIFGWGSCSGCDELQSCRNYEEVDELIKQMHNDIKWFDLLHELKEYVRNKDWPLDYSYHCNETKEFIKLVLEYNEQNV